MKRSRVEAAWSELGLCRSRLQVQEQGTVLQHPVVVDPYGNEDEVALSLLGSKERSM